jgi:hypothetical protein
VNWALFFSIGLQCMCIEQVKTETNLSCLNKKKLLGKVKELFMCFYVICMNKHMGITLSVFLLVLYFFPVSDLRKIALSTTLHPKCLSLVKKLQCVPIVQNKVTMCLFLCSIKIRSQLKHTKIEHALPKNSYLDSTSCMVIFI